jgi:branched-chain amino acid transport system ATP-binding protein
MDELSLGLAPLVVAEVFQLVKKVNSLGVSVLLVEQNARQALRIATRAYLLEVGHVVESGPAAELANKQSVQDIFLGGHS